MTTEDLWDVPDAVESTQPVWLDTRHNRHDSRDACINANFAIALEQMLTRDPDLTSRDAEIIHDFITRRPAGLCRLLRSYLKWTGQAQPGEDK